MRSPLVPCPQCQRHVFAADAACPFCAMELPPDMERRAVPSATRRLTRAATFAFTASLSVVACSSDGGTTPGTGDAGLDSGAVGPIYGAPVEGGLLDAGDGGGVAPLYGLPQDAGIDANDAGNPGVLYGLPPADGGAD
jgi:hypothetical protein